jgi:hypothetical protein
MFAAYDWKPNEDFPTYHLCTAQTFHSNFTLRLKKKLVGFSHYGHLIHVHSGLTLVVGPIKQLFD